MEQSKPPVEVFSRAKADPFDLKTLSQATLLTMRHEIDTLLNLKLDSVNMEAELAMQLMQAKALYAEINNEDDATPANQKAQVLNTISSIIASISKTQAEVYSVTRLKKIESAVLASMTELPVEAKTKFFDLYGEYLAQ